MKKLHIVFLGIVVLFAFALFSRSIKRGAMKELDFAVTVKLQEHIDNSSRLRLASLTGDVMEGVTFFASPMISIIAITVITIIIFIKRKKWRLAAMIIPLVFALMTLAEIYGKASVHHPAPPFFLLKNPTTVFPQYYVWEDYSYPSGHAARAVFLAFIVFPLITYRLSPVRKDVKKLVLVGIILVAYTSLVSVSRIYLGHHWFSDVLGGSLLGGGSALLTGAFLLPYNRNVMKD